MTSHDIDPIKFEVMRSAFVEATEEMAATLRRSAYSTNVKTRQDFSCAFFDGDLRVVAQAFTQAVHLGSFVALVPRAIEIYGVENLEPGDMLVINDPYSGSVHLNDVTVIAPFFLDGELIGYFASLAHHVDVGGGAPASVGAFQEVFREGIIIPPVKLVKRGEINEDVFRLILAQIRSKRETPGDFRAQIAANKTGIRRRTRLIERNGLDEVQKYIHALIDYTRRRTRTELAELPHGTFWAEGFVDNDGFTEDTVHIEVAITIDDDGVVFDTTGSDEQRLAPVHSTFAQTFSACAYALRALIDPDTPVNAGFYEFVQVIAPEGTITNCVHPAPVVGGWETHARLNDIIFKALHQAMPDRVPAGTKAMQCHAGFGGVNPESGEYYCFLETLAGGYGGRRHSDGPDAVQCHGQNTENAPIEETEFNYPVRIPRYELVNDSDGPGRTRGGLGLRRDYMFLDHEVTFTVLADRDKAGPHGLDGGMPGMKASYVLNPDGENVELSSKTTVQLQPGDVISYRTAGGGGFGDPAERPPEHVLKDVRDGKISRERASRFYRVAIAEDGGTVDEAATAELRSGKQ